MMTWNQRINILSAFAAAVVSADRVVLVDGQVFEGRILSESQHEVEIETARNPSRTIRTIQIINRDAVTSLSRGGEPIAVLPERSPLEGVPPDSSAEDLDIVAAHNWLEASTGLLQSGKYEEAMNRFQRIANDTRLVEQSRSQTAEARPALELRIRSYKLWMTAVKGKQKYLEAKADEKEEEAELRLERAEDRLKDYQKGQKYKEKEKGVILLRSKQRGENPDQRFIREVEAAWRNQTEFERWNRANTLTTQNLESEYELLRQQVKQMERELSAL